MWDENDSLTSIGLVNKQIENRQPPENEDIKGIVDYTTRFRTSRINLKYYLSLKIALKKAKSM